VTKGPVIRKQGSSIGKVSEFIFHPYGEGEWSVVYRPGKEKVQCERGGR